MKKGSILGVDLNEKSCQISYYDGIKKSRKRWRQQ